MPSLTKRNAKRLVMAYNAQYLAAGADSASILDLMDDRDREMFMKAQDELVAELKRRSGIDQFRDGDDLLQWAKQR